MEKLQELLAETNSVLGRHENTLNIPLVPEGVFYELISTHLEMRTAIGRVVELPEDAHKSVGIGGIIGESNPFLDEILGEVVTEATKIEEIRGKYEKTLQAFGWLCYRHLSQSFHDKDRIYRGGFFRIVIKAKSVVFQILFLVGNEIYIPGYEGDLELIGEKGIGNISPFRKLPPELEIRDAKGGFSPVDHAGWKNLVETTPLNAGKSYRQPYQSRTNIIFQGMQGMIEEILNLR